MSQNALSISSQSDMSPEGLLDAIRSGAVSLSDGDTDTSEPEQEAPEQSDFDVNEYLPQEPTDSEEVQESGPVSKNAKTVSANGMEHIEEVLVGPKGKQRTVKLDLNDKAKVKEYVQKAYNYQHGMRQFQNERDQLKKQVSEHENDWNTLETLWEKGGAKALISKLSNGDEKAFDRLVDQAIAERQRLEDMSPDERRQLAYDQERQQSQKREQDMQAKYEERLKQLDQQKEDIWVKDTQTKAASALDRFGFDGQLGDADAEHLWNETLWSKALSVLEKLPEGTQPTQEIIDREFRTLSAKLKRTMNVQVRQKTKQAVDTAKTSTMNKIQSHVSKGESGSVEAFRNNMRSGNARDALVAIMSGKVRL